VKPQPVDSEQVGAALAGFDSHAVSQEPQVAMLERFDSQDQLPSQSAAPAPQAIG
jgi:hypothetical protein